MPSVSADKNFSMFEKDLLCQCNRVLKPMKFNVTLLVNVICPNNYTSLFQSNVHNLLWWLMKIRYSNSWMRLRLCFNLQYLNHYCPMRTLNPVNCYVCTFYSHNPIAGKVHSINKLKVMCPCTYSHIYNLSRYADKGP